MESKVWVWMKDNQWVLTVGLSTLIAVVGYGWYAHTHREDLHIPSRIVLVLLSLFVGWFLDVFTDKADQRKVNQMVAFCYVFPFAIFAAILIPLFAFPTALPDPPKPIGIVLGCNERPTEPRDKDLVPYGIRCSNETDQWLVNIGGDAVNLDLNTRAKGKSKTRGTAAAYAQQQANGALAEKPGSEEKANTETRAKAEEPSSVDAEGVAHDQTKLQEVASNDKSQTAKASVEKYELNDRFRITGGLVVPLYFVMLAIFGGFVSMLRRVPEYQERVSEGTANPLSLERAREKLVFEVLQLLAAPLIAITAYYLVDPTSRASSIALAFVAGFSSETVLLYVRAVAEKLQPQTARRGMEVEEQVEVAPTFIDFGTQAVSTVSPPRTIRLRNRSGATLNGTVSVSGEFVCTPSGAFTVATGKSMTFAVTLNPTTPGKKTGKLQIDDDAPSSPRSIMLTGEAQ